MRVGVMPAHKRMLCAKRKIEKGCMHIFPAKMRRPTNGAGSHGSNGLILLCWVRFGWVGINFGAYWIGFTDREGVWMWLEHAEMFLYWNG